MGEVNKEIFHSEDQVIYEQVRLNGFWALSEVKFIVENLEEGYVLLDLGANAGLISLQVLYSSSKDISAVCVEPIPKNEIFIKNNLKGYEFEHLGFALGDKNESSKFYVRASNIGNSSGVKSNVRGDFEVIEVEFKHPSILDQSKLIKTTNSLILKSDLEGMDVLVSVNMSESLWGKIESGVIELWANGNIDPHLIESFGKRINCFAWKSWGPNEKGETATEEITNFLLSANGQIKTLYFKRNRL